MQRGTRARRRAQSGPRIYQPLRDGAGPAGQARAGPRGRAETPREFAARLTRGRSCRRADALSELTEHYGAARFGEREIPDALVTELERAAEELGRAHAATARARPPPAPRHRPHAQPPAGP